MNFLDGREDRSCSKGSSTYIYIAMSVLILSSFAVYFNILWGDFVYDDRSIFDNQWIRDIRNIPSIFTSSMWSFQSESQNSLQNYYRPMSHIIGMINYHLFGFKPWGWRLTNIILHSTVTVLVFLVSLELVKQMSFHKAEDGPASGPGRVLPTQLSTDLWFAFFCSLLFAVHPIHTEAVAWAAVTEAGFALFYLLALYLYIKGHIYIAIIPFFISPLFKETGLTLPLLLFAYDYLKVEESPLTVKNIIKRYLPYILTAMVYIALRTVALGGVAPLKGYSGLTGYEYVINIFPLFAQYLEKLILPVNLNVFHIFYPIHSVLELKGLAGIAVVGTFIASIYLLNKTNRLASFGLLFILVPLLPVFYIRGIAMIEFRNVFSERYLYLPSVGFVILTSILFTNLYKATANRNHSRNILKVGLAGIVAAIVVLYSCGTVMRNYVWRDDYSLWKDAVKKSPASSFARNNLGNAYKDKGDIDKALNEYQTALKIDPWYRSAHNNLGVAYDSLGRFDDAVREYKEVLRLTPSNAMAHYNLANSYYKIGRFEDAILEYKEALKVKYDYPEAHSNLGLAYRKTGLVDNAFVEFQEALRIRPDFAAAYFNLGLIYRDKGLLDEARQSFENALRINPNYIPARQALEHLRER
jgi:protein O-mannosyl-transferase